MNTIKFDETRYFCEHMGKLLAQGDYRTFQCLLADHGLTLTDYIDQTLDSLMPPPDLTTYYHAVQQYITTGELT